MNCIVIDDESLSLQFMTRALGAYAQITSLHAFENAAQALTFARGNPVDIAFLDIEMAELNGIELGRQLRGLHPDLYLVFVTAHAQYAVDAFGIRGNGYLLKPAHPNRIREEVEAAQKQLVGTVKRIRATTFGNFDVFVDDVMVKFPNARAKELLAYLIDRRGASVRAEEAISVLWEERPHGGDVGERHKVGRHHSALCGFQAQTAFRGCGNDPDGDQPFGGVKRHTLQRKGEGADVEPERILLFVFHD